MDTSNKNPIIAYEGKFNKPITLYHVYHPGGRANEQYIRTFYPYSFYIYTLGNSFKKSNLSSRKKYLSSYNEAEFYIPFTDFYKYTGVPFGTYPVEPGDFIALGETPEINSISELPRPGIFIDEGFFRVQSIFACTDSPVGCWTITCI